MFKLPTHIYLGASKDQVYLSRAQTLGSHLFTIGTHIIKTCNSLHSLRQCTKHFRNYDDAVIRNALDY